LRRRRRSCVNGHFLSIYDYARAPRGSERPLLSVKYFHSPTVRAAFELGKRPRATAPDEKDDDFTRLFDFLRGRLPSPEPTPMYSLLCLMKSKHWSRGYLFGCLETRSKDAPFPTCFVYFHYIFVHIDSFPDGNGRTARLLSNLILMQHGYPPIIVPVRGKERYMASLRNGKPATRNTLLCTWPSSCMSRSIFILVHSKYSSWPAPWHLGRLLCTTTVGEIKHLPFRLSYPAGRRNKVDPLLFRGLNYSQRFVMHAHERTKNRFHFSFLLCRSASTDCA